MQYLLEWCATCAQTVGQKAVIDEPGEDINLYEALKEYRQQQETSEPYTCDCGAKLIPQISK